MKKYERKPWGHSERVLLSKKYYTVSDEELTELFPGRTKSSLTQQVHYLRKRGWVFDK